MLLSISTFSPLKRWHCWSRRCFLSLSSRRSTAESPEKGNEWLWAYLRDRKTFQDLNEEQRRRVIDIGSHLILFTFSRRTIETLSELQTLREAGERVPETIPNERWSELLNLSAFESRKILYG